MTFHEILRRHVGRGGVSHAEVAVVVQRRLRGTEKAKIRLVRAWLAGNGQPTATEFLGLCRVLGTDFTNECLETVHLGGVIALKGEITDVEMMARVSELPSDYFDYLNAPGNGSQHRLRRKVASAMSKMRQWLHKPKFHRLKPL